MITIHGVSPLHLAAKEGHVDIVDTLLEHGALPSLQTTVRISKVFVHSAYIVRLAFTFFLSIRVRGLGLDPF